MIPSAVISVSSGPHSTVAAETVGGRTACPSDGSVTTPSTAGTSISQAVPERIAAAAASAASCPGAASPSPAASILTVRRAQAPTDGWRRTASTTPG